MLGEEPERERASCKSVAVWWLRGLEEPVLI